MKITATSSLLFVLIVCLIQASCSGSQTETETSSQTEPTSEPEPVPSYSGEKLTGKISREHLDTLLGRSVGDFIRITKIDVEKTLGNKGFAGWKLKKMSPTTPEWLDIHVGDVVVAVNGSSLERPDDARRAWQSLKVSSEIRIELLRLGEPRTVRIPIVEQSEPSSPPETAAPPEDQRQGPEQ